jgi:hypothetical protein
MVKFTNFCGIFATTFMVATAITIASCSQDDDDYNSNMYTLAEKMETRSGGDPGGGYTPLPNDTIEVTYPFSTSTLNGEITTYISMLLYRKSGKLVAEIISYTNPFGDFVVIDDEGMFIVDSIYFKPSLNSTQMYEMWAVAHKMDIVYQLTVPNTLFY